MSKIQKVAGIITQGAPFDPKMYLTRNLQKPVFARGPPKRSSQISSNAESVQGVVPQGAPFDPKYTQTGITTANVKDKKEEIDAIVSRKTAIRNEITAARIGESMAYEKKSKNFAPIINTLNQLGLTSYATARDATGQAAAIIQNRLADFMRGKTPAERVSQMPLFMREVADTLLRQVDTGEIAARAIPEIIRILENQPPPDVPINQAELAEHVRQINELVGYIAADVYGMARRPQQPPAAFAMPDIPPPPYPMEPPPPPYVAVPDMPPPIPEQAPEFAQPVQVEPPEQPIAREAATETAVERWRAAIERARDPTNPNWLDVANGIKEQTNIARGIITDERIPVDDIVGAIASGIFPAEWIDAAAREDEPPDESEIEAMRQRLAAVMELDPEDRIDAVDIVVPDPSPFILATEVIDEPTGLADINQGDLSEVSGPASEVEEPLSSSSTEELVNFAEEIQRDSGGNERTIADAILAIPALRSVSIDRLTEQVAIMRRNAPIQLGQLLNDAPEVNKTRREFTPFSRTNVQGVYAVFGQLFRVDEIDGNTITITRQKQNKGRGNISIEDDGGTITMDLAAFLFAVLYIIKPFPENLTNAELLMYMARVKGTSEGIRELFKTRAGQPKGIAESGSMSLMDRKNALKTASMKGYGRKRIIHAFNKTSSKLDKLLKAGRITQGQYNAGQKKLAESIRF